MIFICLFCFSLQSRFSNIVINSVSLNYKRNRVKKVNIIICTHFVGNIQSKRVISKCGFEFVMENNDKVYYCLNKY